MTATSILITNDKAACFWCGGSDQSVDFGSSFVDRLTGYVQRKSVVAGNRPEDMIEESDAPTLWNLNERCELTGHRNRFALRMEMDRQAFGTEMGRVAHLAREWVGKHLQPPVPLDVWCRQSSSLLPETT